MRMLLLVSLLFVPVADAQDSNTALVDRLAKSPSDHDAIRGLSGQYDPRVIDAYKAAFEAVTDPEDKKLIAFNLVDDGVKDQKYFDYFAAEAARSRIPWLVHK